MELSEMNCAQPLASEPPLSAARAGELGRDLKDWTLAKDILTKGFTFDGFT